MLFLILKWVLLVAAIIAVLTAIISCDNGGVSTLFLISAVLFGIFFFVSSFVILKWILFAAAIVLSLIAICMAFGDLEGDAGIVFLFAIAFFLGFYFIAQSQLPYVPTKNNSKNGSSVSKVSQKQLERNRIAQEKAVKRMEENQQKWLKQKKTPRNEQKAREQDIKDLEAIAAQKMTAQEILFKTDEPKLYVIATMTYDTDRFVEDNSHDKGLFGSTTDNSKERLTILESCITDFISKTDEKTGVSFLDRSKIEQIEKEHKFQLGDWSDSKKTVEMGKALNANILLFLDKFGFIGTGSGEYRFEAKFVDINTMQSASYNIHYRDAKKRIITPIEVDNISFRGFTALSTRTDSFGDEFLLRRKGAFRTVQDLNTNDIISPLGDVRKLELYEYDGLTPDSALLSLSSISADVFGEMEIEFEDGMTETVAYTFEPCGIYIERIGNDYYTDGKIGTLAIKMKNGYESLDVYTADNREYFLKVGTAKTVNGLVNYYVQMLRN